MKKLWNWNVFLFFAVMAGTLDIASAQGGLNLNLPNRHGVSMVIVEQVQGDEVQDDEVPKTMGVWRAYDHCYGTATILMRHSAHPGGDLGGRLNQDNGGNGGRCYLDPERTWYGLTLGVINSQYGNTLVLGLGKRWTVLQIDTPLLESARIPVSRITLHAGFEAGSIYYEKRFNRGAIFAPFVFPNIAASFRIGKNIEISAIQVFLPDRIKLWGHVFELPHELSGNQEFFPQRQGDYLTTLDHRASFRPMLVLNWRF